MIRVIPIYNTIILPNTTLVLHIDKVKPYFTGQPDKSDDIIFAVMKRECELCELRPDSFYTIGVRARYIRKEGYSLLFKIGNRLELSDFVVNNGRVGLSIKEIPEETTDSIVLSERDNLYLLCEKQRIREEEGEDTRVALKSNSTLDGIVGAISPLMHLSSEERYALTAENDINERKRCIHCLLTSYLEQSTGYYNEMYLEKAAYKLYSNCDTLFGKVSDTVQGECGKKSFAYMVASWFKENKTYTTLRDISNDLAIPIGDVVDGMIELAEMFSYGVTTRRNTHKNSHIHRRCVFNKI